MKSKGIRGLYDSYRLPQKEMSRMELLYLVLIFPLVRLRYFIADVCILPVSVPPFSQPYVNKPLNWLFLFLLFFYHLVNHRGMRKGERELFAELPGCHRTLWKL